MLVPYKYGPDGWSSYRPVRITDLSHFWNESMDPEDWKRIEKVMQGSKDYPLAYSGPWGQNMYNDWPYKIMAADYQEVARRMEFMRNDTRDIYKIVDDDLYPNNPVTTKGLIQVTMGAPQTVYNGGLLRARVRYFDIDRTRPGLPPDVAALVEKLEDKLTVVRLVNLCVSDTRRLIIQAGAFGEHEFLDVTFKEMAVGSDGKKLISDKTLKVNNKYFEVDLSPATTITLEIGTRRFVNKPSYAFP